jgi:hypothetical protein
MIQHFWNVSWETFERLSMSDIFCFFYRQKRKSKISREGYLKEWEFSLEYRKPPSQTRLPLNFYKKYHCRFCRFCLTTAVGPEWKMNKAFSSGNYSIWRKKQIKDLLCDIQKKGKFGLRLPYFGGKILFEKWWGWFMGEMQAWLEYTTELSKKN